MRHASPEILSASGPIARALGEGFEARREQGAMAAAVESALAAQGTLLVEAGTGVGKSFAYLVPAILRCIAGKQRVVIATNTIALQEQLIQKDIPFLLATLAGEERAEVNGWGLPRAGLVPLVPALVKGRGNYVSIRRLAMASARQERIFSDDAQLRSLHAIEDWALTTGDGSLSTLPPLERMSVWDRVQSDSDNCMGRKCPNHAACFYQQSRRLMESANLLVCNHAVFCADLNLRIARVQTAADGTSQERAETGAGFGFLPAYHHVVLDEAHALEDVACEHFGLSLTESRVEHLLGVLHHSRTGKGFLHQLRVPGERVSALDAAHHAVLQALDASRAYFEQWQAHARRGELRGGRITRPAMVDNLLSPAMKGLSLRLAALKDDAIEEQDRFELNAYSVRAAAIAFDAEVLTNQSRAGSVYWLEAGGESESSGRGTAGVGEFPRRFTGRTRLKLACSPIEVGPLLREHLFDGKRSIILTSATMATGGLGHPRRYVPVGEDEADPGMEPRPLAGPEYAHLAGRLGIDAGTTLSLGSPFDHARQAEVYLDLAMPDPRGGQGGVDHPEGLRSYPDALAERILEHVGETEGGAFVLFTSFATLNAVADRLVEPLRDRDLPLLVHGRDGPPSQVLERFRQNDRAVLLGAASFWQGVDVKGRGLRNVIITKLPFDPPDRPLVEARGELIRARGGDPFRDDALPRAILRFKQGFGRLIRSQTDFGRIVILDPRVHTTAYGRRFLEALPRGIKVRRVEA